MSLAVRVTNRNDQREANGTRRGPPPARRAVPALRPADYSLRAVFNASVSSAHSFATLGRRQSLSYELSEP
jgi:hypothetical protein